MYKVFLTSLCSC